MNPDLKGRQTCATHNKVGEANGLGRELSAHIGPLSGRLKVSEKVTMPGHPPWQKVGLGHEGA